MGYFDYFNTNDPLRLYDNRGVLDNSLLYEDEEEKKKKQLLEKEDLSPKIDYDFFNSEKKTTINRNVLQNNLFRNLAYYDENGEILTPWKRFAETPELIQSSLSGNLLEEEFTGPSLVDKLLHPELLEEELPQTLLERFDTLMLQIESKKKFDNFVDKYNTFFLKSLTGQLDDYEKVIEDYYDSHYSSEIAEEKKDALRKEWDTASDNWKLASILNIFYAEDHFDKDADEETARKLLIDRAAYRNLDLQEKKKMAALGLTLFPGYKTLAQKEKETVKTWEEWWKGNDNIEVDAPWYSLSYQMDKLMRPLAKLSNNKTGIFEYLYDFSARLFGDEKQEKKYQEKYAKLEASNFWNRANWFADATLSTLASVPSGLYELTRFGVAQPIAEWASPSVHKLEKADAEIAELAEQTKKEIAAKRFEELKSLPREELNKKIKEFLQLSDKYSSSYHKEKDSSKGRIDTLLSEPENGYVFSEDLLNGVEGEEDKNSDTSRENLLLLIAIFETTGNPFAAVAGISNFWDNTISKRQSKLEKFWHGGVLSGYQLIGTAAAWGGAMYENFTNGIDPIEIGGQVALNPWVKWGNDKFEIGREKFPIYKSVEDQNAVVSLADFPDWVALYGPTAATMMLSWGASKVLARTATPVANVSVKGYNKAMGAVSRATEGSSLPLVEKLAAALESPETYADMATALEAIIRASNTIKHYGNLFIAATLGLGEGAQNACETFDTFMNDNMERIEGFHMKRATPILNATEEQLSNYLQASGELPELMIQSKDGVTTTKYSDYQLARAKQELLERFHLEDAQYQKDIEETRKRAVYAAAVNYWLNSVINGAINVTLKDIILAKDVKTSVRAARGGKKISDLIDVIKSGEGIKAVAKTAKQVNWGLVGKAYIKNATGEMEEEYVQGISDQLSRAMLEKDLTDYLLSVYDPAATNAYLADVIGILNTGWDALEVGLSDRENIKAGISAFFSTTLGGASPMSFLLKFKWENADKDASVKSKLWNVVKNVATNASHLYDNAIMQAYNEERSDHLIAELTAESINKWLGNKDAENLLLHLGGMAGFKRSLAENLQDANELGARDDRLSMAIETILNLHTLNDLDLNQLYLQKVREIESIGELIDLDFDLLGNYVGDNKVVLDLLTEFKSSIADLATSEYSNDREIMGRISKNAQEFRELEQKVVAAQKRVTEMFKGQDLDLAVLNAFVRALLVQEDSNLRADQMLKEVNDLLSTENMTDQEKSDVERKSGLPTNVILDLASLGSSKKISSEILRLQDKKLKLNRDANSKSKTKEERKKAAKESEDVLKQINSLNKRLVAAQRAEAYTELLVTQTEENTTTESEVVAKTKDNIFTVGDMFEMDPEVVVSILNNKEKYSKDLLAEIEKFERIILRKRLNGVADTMTPELAVLPIKDYVALNQRKNAYNNLLSLYLRRPELFLYRANAIRIEERKNALKYKYKLELIVKDGETFADATNRISLELTSLKNQGKEEDAEILKEVINETPWFRNYKIGERVISQGVLYYVNKHQKEIDFEKEDDKGAEDVKTAHAALLAILMNGKNEDGSSLTIDLIKNLFRSRNPETNKLLEKLLFKTSADGLSVFLKQLEGWGYNTDFTGEVGKSRVYDIFNIAKEMLELHTSTLDAAKRKDKEPILAPTVEKKKPLLPPKTPTVGVESTSFDVASTQESPEQVLEYLKEKRADRNLSLIKDSRRGEVSYMVSKDLVDSNGKPVVFAVVPGTAPGAVTIDGKKYNVIGTVNSSASQKMQLEAEQAIKSSDSEVLLSKQATIISMHSPKAISSQLVEEPQPLVALAKTVGESVEKIAKRIVGVTEKIKFPGSNLTVSRTVWKYQDPNSDTTYPVEIKKDETGEKGVSLFSLPLSSATPETTVAEVLGTTDANEVESKEKIRQLKLNKFFNTFFSAWTYKSSSYDPQEGTTPKHALAEYLRKIGNFIYLGETYENGYNEQNWKGKTDHVAPRLEEIRGEDGSINKVILYITPTIEDSREEEVAVEIYVANEDPEVTGLKALRTISEAVAEGKFQWSNPLIQKDNIATISGEARPGVSVEVGKFLRGLENAKLEGLIDMGYLLGYLPTGVKRQMTLLNPYYEKPRGNAGSLNNTVVLNPRTRGIVPGGRINPEDGSVEEGKPQTRLLAVQSSVGDRQAEVLEFFEKLPKKDRPKLPTSNADFYEDENSLKFARVTLLGPSYMESLVAPFKAGDNITKVSTAHGNVMDAVTRRFFEIVKQGNVVISQDNVDAIYDSILEDPAFQNKRPKGGAQGSTTYIPLYEKEQILPFLSQMIKLLNDIERRGWKILSRDITAYGLMPLVRNGRNIGSINAAGTLDLLCVDGNGVVHIIDIKTMENAGNKSVKEQIKDRAEKWSILVNGYEYLLSQEDGGDKLVFGEHYIFPILLEYAVPSSKIDLSVDEDGMTVTDSLGNFKTAIGSPKVCQLIEGEINVDSSLVPIDRTEMKGYDYDKLSPEYQTDEYVHLSPDMTVEESQLTILGIDELQPAPLEAEADEEVPVIPWAPGSGETPEVGPPVVEDTFSGLDELAALNDDANFDAESAKSKRSHKELVSVNFVNERIKPVVEGTLTWISRGILNVKEALGKKQVVNAMVLKDIADTFFDGSVKKLKLVTKGINITLKSLPTVLGYIKDYYDKLEKSTKAAITLLGTRFEVKSMIYDYLDGKISRQKLDDYILLHNIPASMYQELIDLDNANNTAEKRKALKLQLEDSGDLNGEVLHSRIAALQSEQASLSAKVEFLNRENAAQMMQRRLDSVKIATLQEKPLSVNKNATLDRLLSYKEGVYNLSTLLKGIVEKTADPEFKEIAKKLLRIAKNKPVIYVNIAKSNPNEISEIEGETQGDTITINESSLDSYTHLERVLLHESLHLLVGESEELRLEVESIMKDAIKNLSESTGKTELEIKDSYYGFTNVDEFISEYFTNYSFLEMLRTSEDNASLPRSVALKILLLVTKQASMSNSSKLSNTMLKLLSVERVLEQHVKTEAAPKFSYVKRYYSSLPANVRKTLDNLEISEKDFDLLPSIFLEQVLDCCK